MRLSYLIGVGLALASSAALAADGISLWDLSASPRPGGRTREPSVLERGYKQPASKVEVPPTEPTIEVIVEKPVTNTVEVVVEKPVEVVVEKTVTNTVECIVEKPVEVVVEKVVEKPVEVVVEKVVTNTVERIVEKPVEVVVEKVVTNEVERVVYDRSEEYRLAKVNEELKDRSEELDARNGELQRDNDAMKKQLDELRKRCERLERTLNPQKPANKATARTGRPARISSKSTYYDRPRGVVLFDGSVHVDDEEYQLHADKAYVFTSGTNDVRRIVAQGNVAMTNGLRRAYGGKVSYYRKDGMVVLYSGDGVNAEIVDESKAEDQVVRGSKIKFWLNSEQVEVLDATISAPTGGLGADALRR